MSLPEFFAAARAWVGGDLDSEALRALGPTPSSDADLAFYPALIRNGWNRTLRELYGSVAALLEHRGLPWETVCSAYFAAHPPTGQDLRALGDAFPRWLDGYVADVELRHAATSLADYRWCRTAARHAPDEPGLGLERRVFVRRYPVDPVALDEDPAAAADRAVTVLVYRALDDRVRWLAPSLATMAVLAAELGQERVGALALPADVLREERDRLVAIGVVRA